MAVLCLVVVAAGFLVSRDLRAGPAATPVAANE
jgi:hypothetical protein